MDKSMKLTAVVILIVCVLFAGQLISESVKYHGAVRDIAGGEYEAALVVLEELDTYQDSEVLAEYCRIMAEYDASDYASVFRTYYDLKEIEIENKALLIEVTAKRAEISALYVHCGY